MRKKFITLALFAFILTVAAATDTLPVERKVEGQTIVSTKLPAARLTFAPAFHYVGGTRFPLYGVADAEQHFFVDADKTGNIRRFFWVQFEHYLSSNDHTYDYEPVRTAAIGGLEFVHDSKLFTDYGGNEWAADSDSGQMKAFLVSKGLKLPTALQRIRMFCLPNADKRSELMIIYLEALDVKDIPAGVTGETPADERFPHVAKTLIDHVRANLKIKTP